MSDNPNLLQMVQEAASRVGLAQPIGVFGGASIDVQQLLALANQEGRDLLTRHAWQRCIKHLNTFLTLNQEEQVSVPEDFGRYLESTMWNVTDGWPVFGPVSPQVWSRLTKSSGGQSGGSGYRWRLIHNTIHFYPVPPAGLTINYEYVSRHWCSNVSETEPTQAEFASDTDIVYLDPEAFTLGIAWRWQRQKGQDYSDMQSLYEQRVQWAMGQDEGQTTLDLNPTWDVWGSNWYSWEYY